MKKLIAVSLSPNVQMKDVLLALGMLFTPWRWRRGKGVGVFEEQFASRVGAAHAVSFDSGRSALYSALRALDIGEGDEVLVPGFTCVVVSNAVIFTGAKPVYTDIGEDFNVDVSLLEEAFSPRTKAIVVQHTFGTACDMDALSAFAKEKGLKVIEDCAHGLGGSYQGKPLGSFGDMAIWSFGRDKVISCVHGGCVTTNDKDLYAKLEGIHRGLSYPSLYRVFQYLVHPVIFSFVLRLYTAFVGKVLLVFFQKVGILPRVMSPGEKRSVRPSYHPLRLANGLAVLALSQLERLDVFVSHRREIAKYYSSHLHGFDGVSFDESSAYLMYTVRSSRAEEIMRKAKDASILLGVWRGKNIVPPDCDLKAAGYELGTCPRAEQYAKDALNLPTHINVSLSDAERIVKLLNEV